MKYQNGYKSDIAPTVYLLATIFFVSCVARFGMGPLMPTVEGALAMDHGESGMVFLVTSAGYCLGLIGSGFVSFLWGNRNTIIYSSGAVSVALFGTALCSGFASLLIGMFFVGLAGGFYLPAGISTITTTVDFAHRGRAFAIHEVAPNISLSLTPFLVELFLHWMPWRGVVVAFGLASMAGCLAFVFSGSGNSVPGELSNWATLRASMKSRSIWILMLLFSLAIAANVGIYVMLPLFLVSDLGFDQAWANSAVALSRGVGLFIVLAAGMLADRWQPKIAMTVILFICGAFTVLLGVASGPLVIVAVFLQPLLAACFFPSGYSMLTQHGPFAVSICLPIAFFIGAGIIPAMLGAMGDADMFSEAMVLSGVVILLGAPLSWFVEST